tara:strand:- start:305 stop:685 length:381 start_codon:yes stop_codon:yes gene_type:complete
MFNNPEYFLFQTHHNDYESDDNEKDYTVEKCEKIENNSNNCENIANNSTDTNASCEDLVNENRRLYYEMNKEHINKLRLNSRHICPCGSDIISQNRQQHLRSARHRLFCLEHPHIIIPTKAEKIED